MAERLDIAYGEELPGEVDLALLARLPLSFARSRSLLPLRSEGGKLLVACGDPLDLSARDELTLLYGLPVSPLVVPTAVVREAINRHYERLSGSARDVMEELKGEELSEIASELAQPRDLLDLADEAPVIRLLNSILFQAVKERGSDIHLEPFERELEVRFRIDGLLCRVLTPPKVVQEPLISRVKILAGLNIAEKRLPQDGRFKVVVAGREVDIRVSTVPTAFGERVVMRLLERQQGVVTLTQLGMNEGDGDLFRRLLGRTSGIVLVTGPTGSGKTTTLYAALNHLNSPEKNIITIEDPIEYQLPGVGQIQVNPKIDLTFANGLRSILRQDPDIVMVGEIRDSETAEVAMQASLTGHLVLSTLHTNDSATAVTRLVEMG
ncbi:MAG TPA: ATPase, T2SS/T4P/T4SS family, partial [Geobacterales bacterium]|nr:ATPase, T2SS/T4P/T4SS family [Geobacterales bacterium]